MNFRSDTTNAVLNVSYSGSTKTLKVYMDLTASGSFTKCSEITGIDLPAGYLFGVSAATGGLSDNHDVYNFFVFDRSESKPKVFSNVVPSQPAVFVLFQQIFF